MGGVTAPVLVGSDVRLRPFAPADVAARRRQGWHSSIERGYGSDRASGPMTEAEAQAWLADLAARNAAGATCWAVEARGQLAGAVFLFDVRERGRKARLAIGLYAPDLQGQGLGREAIRLVLRHAFSPRRAGGMRRVGAGRAAARAAPRRRSRRR